jgi:hypothetical protein
MSVNGQGLTVAMEVVFAYNKDCKERAWSMWNQFFILFEVFRLANNNLFK